MYAQQAVPILDLHDIVGETTKAIKTDINTLEVNLKDKFGQKFDNLNDRFVELEDKQESNKIQIEDKFKEAITFMDESMKKMRTDIV